MINIGSKVFSAEAIFLQPTYTCAKNCFGCYVKEQEKLFNGAEMDEQVWVELIHEIMVHQSKVHTNQVTLALDTLPHPATLAASKMMHVAEWYFDNARSKRGDMQAHFTVNCISDLRAYHARYGTEIKGIDLVSVSNINTASEIDEIKKLVPGAKVNWNVLSTSLLHKEHLTVKDILTKADQMYLLMHKAPMGHSGNDLTAFYNAVNMLIKFDTSNEPTPEGSCRIPSITDKIVTDGCVADARKFNKTGYGCSSNVSRFQIWPDGRVTGCAYNSHNQYGHIAEDMGDVIDNLVDARSRYEFKNCSIPVELQKFNDGRKHLAVV